MQSGYGVEGDDIAAEELDLDGFFEDDIALQSSHTFTEGAGEAIDDNSLGLDNSVSLDHVHIILPQRQLMGLIQPQGTSGFTLVIFPREVTNTTLYKRLCLQTPWSPCRPVQGRRS